MQTENSFKDYAESTGTLSDEFSDNGNQYMTGFPISMARFVLVDFSDTSIFRNGLDAFITIRLRVGRLFKAELDLPARIIFQANDRVFGGTGLWYPDHGKPDGFGYAWSKDKKGVTLFSFREGWGHQDEVALKPDELSYLFCFLARKIFVPDSERNLPLDSPE